MEHSDHDPAAKGRRPWNAGRMVGAKRALNPQQVWAIRFWLDQKGRLRDRAMFDFAIDSKLRGCDVVKVKISDLVSGGQVRSRARRCCTDPSGGAGTWSGVGGSILTSDLDLALQAEPRPPPSHPQAETQGHELARV
jgi:hypothetical protein